MYTIYVQISHKSAKSNHEQTKIKRFSQRDTFLRSTQLINNDEKSYLRKNNLKKKRGREEHTFTPLESNQFHKATIFCPIVKSRTKILRSTDIQIL